MRHFRSQPDTLNTYCQIVVSFINSIIRCLVCELHLPRWPCVVKRDEIDLYRYKALLRRIQQAGSSGKNWTQIKPASTAPITGAAMCSGCRGNSLAVPELSAFPTSHNAYTAAGLNELVLSGTLKNIRGIIGKETHFVESLFVSRSDGRLIEHSM
jgi:hypothetical protein